eukprot:7107129-Lingulodinium_polyedra.AAC.1
MTLACGPDAEHAGEKDGACRGTEVGAGVCGFPGSQGPAVAVFGARWSWVHATSPVRARRT